MIAILSPAKNIDVQPFNSSLTPTLPLFSDKANLLVSYLKKFDQTQLAELFKVNPSIAETNFVRFQQWFNEPAAALKPAIYAFNGEVYRGFDAKSVLPEQMVFAQNHIRILSGLYGLLKPLDAIQPYRLEMGTHWGPGKVGSLYKFWGNLLAETINHDIAQSTGDKVLLNLASAEYSKALPLKGLTYPVVNVEFKQDENGKLKNITVYAKRARGLMARFLAVNQISRLDEVKAFDLEGYYFDPHHSTTDSFMFVRHV